MGHRAARGGEGKRQGEGRKDGIEKERDIERGEREKERDMKGDHITQTMT